MFRLLIYLLVLHLCCACGSALYPGNISLPQLHEQGDVMLAAAGSIGGQGIGMQVQAAYAISDDWGVQASGQYLNWPSGRTNSFSKPEHYQGYEIGVLHMMRPESDLHLGNNYVLQAGLGFSRSYREFNDLLFDFSQQQVFVQAHSQHRNVSEAYLSFGLRLGLTNVNWINYPNVPDNIAPITYYLRYPMLEYINARKAFILITPIFQFEYPLGAFEIIGSLQPTFVANQIDMRIPATPLTLGIRWHLKG
jgi:hypothetical protein